jgi:hypothetical protein
MQIDFHYYCIAVLARCSGFSPKDALTIAYVSQYVDDSTESEPIQVGDIRFDTVRTAHFGLSAFNWNIQKKIYIPFHFLPESSFANSMQSFITQPQSAFSDELWNFALNQTDYNMRLCMIGTVLHTIADTTAHQCFSGRQNSENSVRSIKVLKNGKYDYKLWHNIIGRIFLPRIGHTEASYLPDMAHLQWEYKDSTGEKKQRNNCQLFLCAAQDIFSKLCALNSTADKIKIWSELSLQIQCLLEKNTTKEEKCKQWETTFSELFHPLKLHYDIYEWRRDALLQTNHDTISWDDKRPAYFKSLKFPMHDNFFNSLWVKFHRVALKHRNFVLENII